MAFVNPRQSILWLLRSQCNLLALAYAWLYYWLFFKLFFGRHIDFVGKGRLRIHPSTHLVMHNSRIIVENGVFSVGYLPGWSVGHKCNIILSDSTLHVMGNVELRPGVEIWAINANVRIGDGSFINGPADIVAKLGVKIGAHCHIAKNTWIADCDMHKHAVVGEQPKDTPREVLVEDHCWIGHGVTILKGVTVGEGSIIGAHSLVTKDVEARSMVVGVPARKIKENIIWEP